MHILGRGRACEVAHGLSGFEHVEVTSSIPPYNLTATVTPDGTGKLIVSSLLVMQSREGGQPIQRGELAKISVEPFIRFVADQTVTPKPPEPNEIDPRETEPLARVYRWIRLRDGKPTAVLAQTFGVSIPTMRRWVGRAVEDGHLTQAERAK